MFNLNLLAVLQFNIATGAEANQLHTQLQDGLVTETEYLKKLIDLASRHNALPVETLAQFADAAFPYGVVTGKYESDGEESCQYSDDFASLRDAIVAWEEYSPGSAWARVHYRVDNFVYGLDPYKVLRAKKVTDDKGEKRTLYMPCDVRGNFRED
jgi:hypothetical protein